MHCASTLVYLETVMKFYITYYNVIIVTLILPASFFLVLSHFASCAPCLALWGAFSCDVMELPALSANLPAVCGGADTRLTLCFPGTPDEATCVYHVISNYSSKALPTSTQLRNCPQKPLFGGPCQSLPGTLYIAYGPCNSDDTVLPANATDSLAVSDWLDVLGINSIQVSLVPFSKPYLKNSYAKDSYRGSMVQRWHQQVKQL